MSNIYLISFNFLSNFYEEAPRRIYWTITLAKSNDDIARESPILIPFGNFFHRGHTVGEEGGKKVNPFKLPAIKDMGGQE